MMITSIPDEDRPKGYYWIAYPYPPGDRHWEPAGWSVKRQRWICLGTVELMDSKELIAIGPPCGEPMPEEMPEGKDLT